jgi:hypothetical protein
MISLLVSKFVHGICVCLSLTNATINKTFQLQSVCRFPTTEFDKPPVSEMDWIAVASCAGTPCNKSRSLFDLRES